MGPERHGRRHLGAVDDAARGQNGYPAGHHFQYFRQQDQRGDRARVSARFAALRHQHVDSGIELAHGVLPRPHQSGDRDPLAMRPLRHGRGRRTQGVGDELDGMGEGDLEEFVGSFQQAQPAGPACHH